MIMWNFFFRVHSSKLLSFWGLRRSRGFNILMVMFLLLVKIKFIFTSISKCFYFATHRATWSFWTLTLSINRVWAFIHRWKSIYYEFWWWLVLFIANGLQYNSIRLRYIVILIWFLTCFLNTPSRWSTTSM